ncbi:MAG: redoxin domain-containing protein [Akkermansiaceae bacterium]|nr:redoxin domain-containing protein [Akkermansiaceae bacterium]
MMFRILFLFVALSHLSLLSAKQLSKVENFALIDHEGKFHELNYYLKLPRVKGLVIFIQGNGCPLVQKRIPELDRMRTEFEKRGILFCMLNANLQDELAEIRKEAESFKIAMPILKDEAQIVAQALGVERTAEAYLISAKGKKIVYRGAVDDRLSYQTEKPKAEKHYLKDAIESLLGDRAIEPAVTDAPGCRVTFPKFPGGLTYTRDVAPILAKNCVSCHSKGGLGPFPMSNYRKVAGWSDMIAEVILTKQMPPWHADPEVGEFSNDCSLSPEEAHKIVSWVAAGSPKGEGADPLENFKVDLPKWHLGEPDKVIQIPTQKLVAEGFFDYRYVTIDNPFDRDVWLTASEIRPGNTKVLHHVIVTSHAAGRRKPAQWITGYAPGTQGQKYPAGSSVHLRKGHKLRLQLHYTASGKPEIDETQLGFHVSDKPTPKIFRTAIVANSKFQIPPGSMNYGVSKTHLFPKNVTLYAINPHMHFRGKFMNFEAEFKNGRRQALLSVPNYNFNWQRTYVFEEPLKLPAGSRVHIRNAWDNSRFNPYNPDPQKTVKWGDQTFDEMFFATLGYIED